MTAFKRDPEQYLAERFKHSETIYPTDGFLAMALDGAWKEARGERSDETELDRMINSLFLQSIDKFRHASKKLQAQANRQIKFHERMILDLAQGGHPEDTNHVDLHDSGLYMKLRPESTSYSDILHPFSLQATLGDGQVHFLIPDLGVIVDQVALNASRKSETFRLGKARTVINYGVPSDTNEEILSYAEVQMDSDALAEGVSHLQHAFNRDSPFSSIRYLLAAELQDQVFEALIKPGDPYPANQSWLVYARELLQQSRPELGIYRIRAFHAAWPIAGLSGEASDWEVWSIDLDCSLDQNGFVVFEKVHDKRGLSLKKLNQLIQKTSES